MAYGSDTDIHLCRYKVHYHSVTLTNAFTSYSSQNENDVNDRTLSETQNLEQIEENAAVNVLAICMKSNDSEILIQRHIVPHSEVTLGTFLRDDVCIIVLSNGEGVRITRLMLSNDISSLCVQSKRLTLTTPVRTDPNLIHTVSYCKVNGMCTTVWFHFKLT